MASPPFAIAELIPGDADIVAQFPNAERLFRDIVESWLTIIADPTTGRPKVPVGDTATVQALTYPVGAFRYDTTKGVLEFQKASGQWDALSVPAGTRAIFFQEFAPPGWTKLTDVEIDGAIIELVTGITGGDFVAGTAVGTLLAARTIAQANLPNVNFAISGTANSAGDHTHTTDSQGAHRHFEFADAIAGSSDPSIDNTHSPARDRADGTGSGNYLMMYDDENILDATLGLTSEAGGHTHTAQSAGAHTHTLTGNAASGGSGTALDFAVKRVRAIVCQKN